jgi:hypothetical protein
MLDHILAQIQERLESSLDDLAGREIPANLMKRINTIARNTYKDLKITYFTYEEIAAILETEEPIIQWKGHTGVMFLLLKPTVEQVETEEGFRLQIEMALDYQIVN